MSADCGADEAWTVAALDLVEGVPSRLTVEQARALRLGGWCFFRAAAGSEHRRELAAEFFQDWMAYRRRVALIAPLMAAWRRAGVHVCAFKGLAVAAAFYPHAGLRPCGDVDLVIDPDQVELAKRCVPQDWQVVTTRINTDIAFYLVHRVEGTLVELHHSLVPLLRMGRRKSWRLTRRMLAASLTIHVCQPEAELDLPVLQPVDLLLAMVLNRSWSADAWRHRAHDFLDMRYAAESLAISRADLIDRAKALGIERTVVEFLRTCDPWRRRLDLVSARRSTLHRWWRDLALLPTEVPPHLVWFRERAIEAPQVLWRTATALPVVWSVAHELRRQVSPAMAANVTTSSTLRPWPPWRIEQAVSWALWFLRPWVPGHLAGPCVLHSLSVLRLMRRMGLSATWNLGHAVLPDGRRLAHAWVATDDAFAFGVDHEREIRRFRVAVSTQPRDTPAPPSAHGASLESHALSRQP